MPAESGPSAGSLRGRDIEGSKGSRAMEESTRRFGSDGGEFNQLDAAVKHALDMQAEGADIIDINMGCPSFKLSKKGAGAKILDNIELIHKIVTLTVKSVKIPVTVKIRAGWNDDKNAVKIAKTIEKAGASAITIHARTGKMKFRGKADWTIIKKIKKAVKIPVIGNGDVRSAEDAIEMIKKTGCDFVMIGRAAVGKPWLFSHI